MKFLRVIGEVFVVLIVVGAVMIILRFTTGYRTTPRQWTDTVNGVICYETRSLSCVRVAADTTVIVRGK